jgi:hypothetical protein
LALASACNRAGRIMAAITSDKNRFKKSLLYFNEGIKAAEKFGDSWFYLANCVEALELIQREYENTSRDRFWKIFQDINKKIDAAIEKNASNEQVENGQYFPELLGRREIVAGTMAFLRSRSKEALRHYLIGFKLVTKKFFGSFGLLNVTQELDKLHERVKQLPPQTARHWRSSFAKEWQSKKVHETLTHFAANVYNLM